MYVISFFLLLAVTPGVASDSLHTDSTILPPPNFLDRRISELSPDGLADSDSVNHDESSVSVRRDSHLDRNPSSFGSIDVDQPIASPTLKENTYQAVPGPPRNLSVFAENLHHISMDWDAPSNNGGNSITGYNIEWSTDGATWVDLIDNVTPVFFDFYSSRLTPGETFHFRVRAVNSDGEGSPSDEVMGTAVVASGIGTPTNVMATQTSLSGITVSWNAPTDLSQGQSVGGYAVYRSDDGGDFWTSIADPAPNQFTYSDTDNALTVGTTYSYRVTSTVDNSESSLSSPASVAFASALPPDPPTNARVNLSLSNFHSMYIQWNVPSNDGGSPITGYNIEWSTDGTNWEDPTETAAPTAHIVYSSRLTPGQTFYFRVRAVNSTGEGSPSNVAMGTALPSTGIGIPTNVRATQTSLSEINVSWDAPTDLPQGQRVFLYNLFRSDDGGYSWELLRRIPAGDGLSYADSDNSLTVGTMYGYRLSSTIIGIPVSSLSSPSFVTFRVPPDAPSSLRATSIRRTSINLSWRAPQNEGSASIIGYRIQSSPDNTDTSNWSNVVANTGDTQTSYPVTGLSPNTRRFYRVYAINSDGESLQPSNVIGATTLSISAPAAPPGLTAQASGSSVILSWSAPDNGGPPITGYSISFNDQNTAAGWMPVAEDIASTTRTYTHTNLEFQKTYYYYVTASNALGYSAISDIVSARPTGTAVRPDPPRSLTANPGGSSIINLSWDAPASHGGAAITEYRVQWSADGTSGSWTNLTPNTRPPATSRQHTGLDEGTTRHYRVYAINSVGESTQPSNVAMATTTTGGEVAPDTPTSVRATASGQTTINLSWTAPTSSGSTPLFGYRIEVSEDAGTNWDDFSRTESFLTTSDAHRGLTAGTTRHYRIFSINHQGLESEASDVVSATTGTTTATAPSAPRTLRATASGQTTINLSWTAPSSTGGSPITGYRIQWSADGSSPWTNLTRTNTTATATTDSHTGLTAGTTRHYRVYAINSVGESAQPSNVISATTSTTAPTAPDAPTSLTATASGQTTINLSWTAPSSTGGSPITGYRIQWSADGSNPWTNLTRTNTTATATTDSHTGLTAGTTRHYRVYAINSVGESAQPSNVISATTSTTAPTAPDAPTSLTATASGQTTINLSWTAPSSTGGSPITGYRIQWSADGSNPWTNLTRTNTTATATTDSHTGLTAGTTRHYRVYAINSVGESAQPSNVASSTTTTPATTADVVVSFDATASQVNEDGTTATVQVNVNPASPSSLTITYSLGGTATENADYTIEGSGSITIAANATSANLSIAITNDQVDESNETIIVTLTSGAGYDLGNQNIHTLTIADDDDSDVQPLSFATTIPNQSFTVGVPIDEVVLPDAVGGTQPYRYALTPDLPEGLEFDATTQTLSGTPSKSISATTYTYMVTDDENATAIQTFTIEVIAPQALVFADSIENQMYPAGKAIADLVLPSAMGGVPPYDYTLTPDPPKGLTFEAETRTLSGTPPEVTDSKVYTYTVEDRAGTSTKLGFNIQVYTISFTETVPNQSYPRGQAIDPLVLPVVTGGVPPIQYTLTLFDLPFDLRFDAPSRTISGTPLEITPPISLTYTATDHHGAQDSLLFSIGVISPVHTDENPGIPQELRGYSNYPNPFRSSTNLVFDLPWTAQVQVEVMDVTGRRLVSTPSVYLTAGWGNEIELSDLNLPSGAYLYRIHATSLDDRSSSVYVGHFMSVK